MTGVSDIWAEILDAAREVGPRPSRLDEHLVNGAMLVTPRQFDELTRVAHEFELKRQLYGEPWSQRPSEPAIPVVVVHRRPVYVGNNQMAFLGPDEQIYVYDRNAVPWDWSSDD